MAKGGRGTVGGGRGKPGRYPTAVPPPDPAPDAPDTPNRPAPGTPPGPGLEPAVRAVADVVAALRAPGGCPWDREQTLQSIKPHTLEEVHELFAAVDALAAAAPADRPARAADVRDELGDVLLQVLLDAQIAADDGLFDLAGVVEGLKQKLVRRHPHVFGDAATKAETDVSAVWREAKAREREAHGDTGPGSVFDGVPNSLPALAAAKKLSHRAASAGYDFPDRRMLFDKLAEELAELNRELFDSPEPDAVPAGVGSPPVPDGPIADPARRDRAEAELGDVLFVVANVARRWGLDPEQALLRSNRKFAARVRYIEAALAKDGRELRDADLREMERLYQEGKRGETP